MGSERDLFANLVSGGSRFMPDREIRWFHTSELKLKCKGERDTVGRGGWNGPASVTAWNSVLRANVSVVRAVLAWPRHEIIDNYYAAGLKRMQKKFRHFFCCVCLHHHDTNNSTEICFVVSWSTYQSRQMPHMIALFLSTHMTTSSEGTTVSIFKLSADLRIISVDFMMSFNVSYIVIIKIMSPFQLS